jgi:polysaccharide pyruvyl transferase WcaK-like protein
MAQGEGGAAAGGVALLSPSGWGNLGDAAIVDSVIQAVRRRRPGWPIAALTMNPPDTARRHGVPAFTCSGFSSGDYGVAVWAPHALPGELESPPAAPPGEPTLTARLRSTLRHAALPLLPVRRGLAEARHIAWLERELGRPRVVVVAGGGQLDDFWGGPFGHPYVLWRWARFARSNGARWVVLSVGTGSLKTPAARWFVRHALHHADYRSFRDAGSKALLHEPLVQNDPVVPDLAFGLDLRTNRTQSAGRRRRVGISPIAYADPRTWPVPGAPGYAPYIERLSRVCAQLLSDDHELVLFTTDRTDEAPRDDLCAAISRNVPASAMERVARPVIGAQAELYAVLREVDLVVASRLHGALLSHAHGVPVFALSYERKVAALLADAGHARYCVSIDDFEPGDVCARVAEMLARHDELSEEVAGKVDRYRQQVNAQYDLVFGPPPA